MLMKFIIKLIIFIGLGIAIYSNAFHSEWHFDDLGYILHNSDIRNIADIKAIWTAYPNSARFVPYYTFALNYHFHQYDVFGYHVVNVMIHLITALLVWWMATLILATPRLHATEVGQNQKGIAFFAALIFLVHPIQIQAVTYITQRFASLATLFYVLSICLVNIPEIAAMAEHKK